MVLMSMGDYNLLNVIFQVGDIRNDQVDSEHILLRER